jgi:hypothetical protein
VEGGSDPAKAASLVSFVIIIIIIIIIIKLPNQAITS